MKVDWVMNGFNVKLRGCQLHTHTYNEKCVCGLVHFKSMHYLG